MIVGNTAAGSIEINNSSVVTDADGFIAYDPTGSGIVTVTGPGSQWINSGVLHIGHGATGLLNISNGGIVTASSGVVIYPTGTLSGDGRLISSLVANFGTIKPGNSIGTLTIDGRLLMEVGSTYEVEVDNSGNSDLLSVTADVIIFRATVQAVSTETITGSQQYTVIQASNVTGTFDTVDPVDTALLDSSVLYATDSVLLQIDATPFDDPSIVQTDNQSSLGRALQQIADGGGNSITTALQGLASDGQVRCAYNQLSGQTRPQLTSVTAADTSKFMGIVSDRLHNANQGLSYYGFDSGPLFAMAELDRTNDNTSMYDTGPNFAIGNGTTNFGYEKWGFWGKGYGVYGDRETEGRVPGYQYTIYGTSFGLDHQITDSTLLGITAGFSDGDVDSSLAGNKGDISGTHIGIYGNRNADDWHFDCIFTYSFLEYETERLVNLTGEKLKGDFNGQGISGYVEARYDWRNLDSWLLQPLASFQFSYLGLGSYTESGGTSRLGYDDQSYNSYKGSLGLKLTKELFRQENDRGAHIQLRGRWVHEFGDDNSSVDAHFASYPGVVFKVRDEDIARDSAVLGAGFDAELSRHTRLLLGYDAQLNNDDNMHVLSAMFVYRW
ncbi:autotransporter domain-containing protein [Planctomycetota bacterium]